MELIYNDNTKLYLKKAIDIYHLIQDERIEYYFENSKKVEVFTTVDKKIMSLFTAGFLVQTNASTILKQHPEFKLQDILNFLNINEEDIKSIFYLDYAAYFEETFKQLITEMTEYDSSHIVKYYTPEYIISNIEKYCSDKTPVFINYRKKYNIMNEFNPHIMFKKLNDYALSSGSIVEKNKRCRIFTPNDFFPVTEFDNETYYQDSMKPCVKESNLKSENIILENNDRIWNKLDMIKNKFIGQEEITENLFYNIINNQIIAKSDSINDGQRSIIFIDGSSGTGKTAIAKEITKELDIPFIATSVVEYSAEGYVGGSITDILKNLYKTANNDIEKAQRGIVVLDEFDKIANTGDDKLEMRIAVQQLLLNFLGGGKYFIDLSDSPMFKNLVEFDTSKLSFICLGALTNLRKNKMSGNKEIGFIHSYNPQDITYSITPQDLINLGFEKELIGRFNTYLHTNDYSIDDYIKILKESTISPLKFFIQWVKANNKKVIIDDDIYKLIAEQAYNLNLGARGLQTVMNNIRTHFLKDVLRGTDATIYLNSEVVTKTGNKVLLRKGRL